MIDDVPYGFKEGVMVTGWYTEGEDKYYFEPNGAMRVGWLWDGAWYYLDEGYNYGVCVTDTMRDIFGTVYAFDKNGKMITGWYSDTYKYEQEDGTTEEFTDWYYFNSDGSMNRDGWLYWNGGWYYLDKYSGVMAKDDSYYINGVRYFFDANGKMREGGWYFDSYVDEYNNERGSWYYLNADGSYKTGWIWDKGWYYLQEDGIMVDNGVRTIDGEDYLFNASGLMISGWYQTYYYNDEGKKEYSTWYYGKSDGTVYTGWLKWGNAWYYLSEYTGAMYEDGVYYINESKEYFAFEKSGKMATGWYYDEYIWTDMDGVEHDDGDWYFMDSNGYAQHGWLKWNNKWYYLNEYNGAMYEDIINIMVDGKYYSFDESGAMRTGWIFESYGFTDEDGNEYGTWYYFGPSGDKQFGWILDGKTWYYLDRANGTMYDSGMYFIDGKYYAFDESGAMLTGWIEDEYDNVYYFDTNGAGYTGFIDKDGNKGYKEGKDMYYCDHGWRVTDGSYYIKGEGKYGLFDEDGYFINFAPEPTEHIAEKAAA